MLEILLASVYPNKHREFGCRWESRGPEDVQSQTIIGYPGTRWRWLMSSYVLAQNSRTSTKRRTLCKQPGPKSLASKLRDSIVVRSTGRVNRNSPTGARAKGSPIILNIRPFAIQISTREHTAKEFHLAGCSETCSGNLCITYVNDGVRVNAD